MSLILTTIDDRSPRTGDAVPGYPTINLRALPSEALLSKVLPENMVSYLTPGRGAITASPIQERDSCTGNAIWTAQTTGTTTATDGAVLGGLPRWDFDGVSAGLYGSLPAALTDYTFACLARADNVSGAKSLITVGSLGATRAMLYFNNATIALQHGTTDVKASGNIVAANTWTPIIVSYKGSTKALRIYTTTTSTVVSATMTNSPPADVVSAIGSTRAGAQPLLGEIALAAIWNTPVHEDATALTNLVTALNGLRGL